MIDREKNEIYVTTLNLQTYRETPSQNLLKTFYRSINSPISSWIEIGPYLYNKKCPLFYPGGPSWEANFEKQNKNIEIEMFYDISEVKTDREMKRLDQIMFLLCTWKG